MHKYNMHKYYMYKHYYLAALICLPTRWPRCPPPWEKREFPPLSLALQGDCPTNVAGVDLPLI